MKTTNLSKRRWLVLIASCLINLCAGSQYAWSVFANPMMSYLNANNGTALTSLSIVFTVANSVGPITMIFGGSLVKKLGCKWVIFIGGIMFGLGMILSGFAQSLTQLVFCYGILLGLGCGAIYGCTVSNSIKFFPDKKGLVGGLAAASYGLSSVLVPPIANALIPSVGITSAFKLIGAVMMLVICCCAMTIVTCPDGFAPEGFKVVQAKALQVEDKNWKQMLSSAKFYIMILMLCCGAVSGMMIISGASPVAQNMLGISAAVAATAVSVLALFNTFGRILAGYVSDRIGIVATLRIVFVCSMLGQGLLYFSAAGAQPLFFVGLCIVGLAFGSVMGIYPAFTVTQFGAKNNSVNYGIMFIGFAFAGYVGPVVLSSIYDAQANYRPAFLMAAGLALGGFLLSFLFTYALKKGQVTCS